MNDGNEYQIDSKQHSNLENLLFFNGLLVVGLVLLDTLNKNRLSFYAVSRYRLMVLEIDDSFRKS